jgi:hypothetical protein
LTIHALLAHSSLCHSLPSTMILRHPDLTHARIPIARLRQETNAWVFLIGLSDDVALKRMLTIAAHKSATTTDNDLFSHDFPYYRTIRSVYKKPQKLKRAVLNGPFTYLF